MRAKKTFYPFLSSAWRYSHFNAISSNLMLTSGACGLLMCPFAVVFRCFDLRTEQKTHHLFRDGFKIGAVAAEDWRVVRS